MHTDYGVPAYIRARSSSLASLHQVDELVEQIFRIVRPGGGLGVVLHRKSPSINEFDAFDHAVVGAGVAHHGRAERGVEGLTRLPSSAKPWFCAVTATRPVAWSITGMLIPRWPNTIL